MMVIKSYTAILPGPENRVFLEATMLNIDTQYIFPIRYFGGKVNF